MQLNESDFMQLIKNLSSNEDIQIIDIPDIDLYMDQVTTFMEKKLEHNKRNKKDKILTKTMINNYTKDGILLPPHNKKYSRQHMILLILVYNLKQILSIKDIAIIMSPLLEASGETNGDPVLWEKIYTAYLDLKPLEIDFSSDVNGENLKTVREKTKGFGNYQKDVELFLIILLMADQANKQKRLIEKVIDDYCKA